MSLRPRRPFTTTMSVTDTVLANAFARLEATEVTYDADYTDVINAFKAEQRRLLPGGGAAKRLVMEFAETSLGRIKEECVVSWQHLEQPKRLPLQWVFNFENSFEIVVQFPPDYPFKAPYYFVKTDGGKLVDLKKFLVFVVSPKRTDRGKEVVKGPTEESTETSRVMEMLSPHLHSPAIFVPNFINSLLEDDHIRKLLPMAPTFKLHEHFR